MKCKLCNEVKLSREFPPQANDDPCEHPHTCCLECVINRANKNDTCPYPGCKNNIKDRLDEYKDILNYLFPPLSSDVNAQRQGDQVAALGDKLFVTSLTGETTCFSYSDSKTVEKLKQEIRTSLNVAEEEQRLLFGEVELKMYDAYGEAKLLKDYDVRPGSTLHLIILLFRIPEGLKKVNFQLSWTYPGETRDFLDATCFLYMKDRMYSWVDWRWTKLNNCMSHSGDSKIDDIARTGYQEITADLEAIPKCVSHLVFTLSSFRAPTIAEFREPKLKFFDVNNTSKDLTSYEVRKAISSQAVIVCCVARTEKNQWFIWESGMSSQGNTQSAYIIRKTIEKELIPLIPGISLETGEPLWHYMTPEEQLKFEERCQHR